MRTILYGFLVVLFVAGACTAYSVYRYVTPTGAVETTVVIPPHTGVRKVLTTLYAAGLTPPPPVITLPLLLSRDGFKIKAGEYYFQAGLSPKQMIAKMVRGEVVVHKFTVPEGWTSTQARLLIQVQPLLTGELPEMIPEGSLFPDTVHFVRGEDRAKVVARMQKAQREMLQTLWAARAPDAPVTTPQQALILASVVEKETGVGGERAKVAGVFANRLRRGMPLQSDPTVVYGLMAERGGAPVSRALTTADLRRDTPYNTYTRTGLPPGPICNPGRAAVEAVLHPATTDALYFVATGHGGHSFAATLPEHNANVARYRAVMRAAAAKE